MARPLAPSSKPDPEIEKLKARYRAAMDAVGRGVELNLDRDKTEGAPKRLRFGVISALVSVNAMLRVLKDKCLIGEIEHLEALAEAAEEERASYERLLSVRYGREVKLDPRS